MKCLRLELIRTRLANTKSLTSHDKLVSTFFFFFLNVLQLQRNHETSRTAEIDHVHTTTIKKIIKVSKLKCAALVDVLFKGVGEFEIV